MLAVHVRKQIINLPIASNDIHSFARAFKGSFYRLASCRGSQPRSTPIRHFRFEALAWLLNSCGWIAHTRRLPREGDRIVSWLANSVLGLRIPCENRVASPFHNFFQVPEEAISRVSPVMYKPLYIEIASFIGGRDDPPAADCFRGRPFLLVRFLLDEQKKMNRLCITFAS